MPGSPAALPGSSHAPCSDNSKASHLALWFFQKGESGIPSSWHPIPLGLSCPGAFIYPSPKLPSTGVHIAPSLFPPLPTFPQRTHPLWAGELSLPGGLSELEGEDSLRHSPARVGTVWGRPRGRAEGGSTQDGGPWGAQCGHHEFTSAFTLQSLGCAAAAVMGLVVCGGERLPAPCPPVAPPAFIGPEQAAGEEAGPRSTPRGGQPRLWCQHA